MFGNPKTTTGGNALKFYASVRIEVRRIESIDAKGEEVAVGNRVRVKVVKNKVAPPFRKVELDIYFGKGISAISSILDAAVKHELIDKRGAWFSIGEDKIGQGRENAIKFLEDNADFRNELEEKLRIKLFPGQITAKEPQKKTTQPAAEIETKVSVGMPVKTEAPKATAKKTSLPPEELF